MLTMSF